MVADASAKEGDRLKAIDLLRQVRDPRSEELFLEQIGLVKSDALKVGLLGGLEAFDVPRIAATVIESYPGYSLNAKRRAIQMLLARSGLDPGAHEGSGAGDDSQDRPVG